MTMQAGTYYVGDLCYVMHDAWSEVCDLIIEGHSCKEGEFTLADGRKFAIYNTAYGDGTYSSNGNGSYCVDSGSIGCIRVEDIRDETYSPEVIDDLGQQIVFENDFSTRNDRGTLCFGHVEVYTGDDPSYEEEEEEYYEEEEEYDY